MSKELGNGLKGGRWLIGLLLLACGLQTARSAASVRPLLKDFIGINGHTVLFKPELYRPVATLVRDYHPVEWDLGTNTAVLPDWPFAKNRVDWSHVYGSWQKAGWRTDVSLMFESIARTNWTDIEADARAYGRAFAREFGPSGARRLVEAVEIGNEPGQWSDADYAKLFRAMASGIREGDPQLRIATCNLTVGASGDYEKSVRCLEGLGVLYDVLNIHTYAQLEGWPTWRRSFPEDPKLPKYLQDVEALCRWRDEHAAGKPVWITEFGYDSSTKPPSPGGDFEKWVGVTDAQQAQWNVRSVLVFSAMPVERAYVYFFNDSDEPKLHAAAGLTRNFEPKPAFHAMAHLQTTLGEYRFDRILTNAPGELRVQAYRHGGDASRTVWAVWSPTGEGRSTARVLGGLPGRLVKSETMPLQAGAPSSGGAVVEGQDGVRLTVTESPIYLWFEAEKR